MASFYRYIYGARNILLRCLMFLKSNTCGVVGCELTARESHKGLTKLGYRNHICKLTATKKDGRSHPSTSVVHFNGMAFSEVAPKIIVYLGERSKGSCA